MFTINGDVDQLAYTVTYQNDYYERPLSYHSGLSAPKSKNFGEQKTAFIIYLDVGPRGTVTQIISILTFDV